MSHGVVVLHSPDESGRDTGHESVTHRRIGERLAALLGFDLAGEHDPSIRYPGRVYFLPNDTVVGIRRAREIGIRDEHDLFGGVVPHHFVATKAITHPLVGPDAAAPDGWSPEFSDRVRGSVPRGFSVFDVGDARRAAARLLAHGPARTKPARATGGRGQTVFSSVAEMERALDAVDPAELRQFGLVLEENLTEVETFSIGQVSVAGLTVSYHGTQRLTPDNRGKPVYGGSDLVVVRGGFDVLLDMALPERIGLAARQARTYDAAALASFPGLFASRRNYDVVQGLDAKGRRRSGVLEQSWRVGGASGAEIAAIEAFRDDPSLNAVRASCVEAYGDDTVPPSPATVTFRGCDDVIGPLVKYTLVEPHGDA